MAFNVLDYLNNIGAGAAIPGAADRSLAVNTHAGAPAAPKPNFVSNLAHSAGNVVASTAGAIAHTAVDGFTGLYHDVAGNLATGHAQNNLYAHSQTVLTKQQNLDKAFAAKKIDRQTYVKGLNDLKGESMKASAEAHKVAGMHRAGAGEVAGHYAQAAGTVASVVAPYLAPEVGAVSTATKLAAARAGVTGAEVGQGANAARSVVGAVANKALAVPGVQRGVQAIEGGLGVGKGFGPSVITQLPGKLARNALVTQPIVNTPGQIGTDLKNKNYGDAALQAGTVALPAVLKGAGALVSKLAPEAQKAMFGRQGFFDAVKAAGGPDVLSHLNTLKGAEAAKAENALRQLQQYNLDQFKGNTGKAAAHFVEEQRANGVDITKADPQTILKNAVPWLKANQKIQGSLDELGKSYKLKDGESFIAARFNPQDRKNLVGLLDKANSQEQRQAIIKQQIDAGAPWTKVAAVRAQVEQAVGATQNPQDWRKAINKLTALRAIPAPYKLPGGYFVGVSKAARATVKDVAQTAALDRGAAPASKVLGKVGTALTKAGLSPQASDNSVTYGRLIGNLQKELDNRGIEADAKKLLGTLNKVDVAGATDARMLKKSEIQAAIGTSIPERKLGEVQKALRSAYANLPASQTGIGPKVLNKLIEKAPLEAKYLRYQQAGRYELNPFFKIKQQIKSSLIAYGEGKTPGVKASEADNKALQDAGFFNAKGSKVGSDAGIGSSIGPQSTGTGGALLAKGLRGTIGGLAASIAKKNGTTVKAILSSDTPLRKEFEQSLSITTSYGKGGYLNSPLAKTLNLAIFPSRFETKVITKAAKAFAHQPAAVQVGLTHSLLNASNYLGSPEGKQWQKDNSELIGIVKAFTPLQTIDNFNNFLNKGHHVGDLGELGGLPLGLISTLLEHQGVNLGKLGTSQYDNPKTGEAVPDKIPQTDKARLQQGFTDLISSMFSYPGKTAGLSSKTDVIQTSVPFLKPNKTDVKPRLKDGSTPAAKSVAPTSPKNLPTITKGTAPTLKQVPIVPVYKAGTNSAGKAPKRKIYAMRRGQGGF